MENWGFSEFYSAKTVDYFGPTPFSGNRHAERFRFTLSVGFWFSQGVFV